MKLFDYFLYAVVVFGWSTSWFPLKMQLGVVAPEVSLFWRFLIASFLMFVISFASKQTLRFTWRTHLRIAALGLCLFSSNFTLFYYAGLNTTSGLLAVMFSLASLINVLMVAALTRTAPKPTHIIAALVGIGGVCLLFWPELQISESAVMTILLCFMGTMFFCTGNMVSASAQKAGFP
ncbi:DMT family transporter, partial [Candidatus Puniceispirillum sp.]|uniref:DMT family transporter n=1 Tax=Candidatus Puniceispirillum sp. TaxID=2026719 RepID=UPI003F69974A